MNTRLNRLESIRNIGIVAHVDAGKTTLTERVLFVTGRIHAMGEVHHGTAHTDSDPSEQKHGITIAAAALTCPWREHLIELIDTPGHVDFAIEVERSLRVLDAAVVVLDGVAGVEAQTQAVWRRADHHGIPRLIFVNKLDRAGASLSRTLDDVRTRLDVRAVALTLPFGQEEQLRGVVDVLRSQVVVWEPGTLGKTLMRHPVPDSHLEELRRARLALIEACAEHDEAILSAFVEGREVEVADLERALRKGTVAGALVPVLCGSAYRHIGIQPLLDAVLAFLPSPADRPAIRGPDGSTRSASETEPTSALVFKVVATEHGQRAFVRVYSGALRRGESVLAMRHGRAVRIGRLVRPFADRDEEIEIARAGEIAVVLGLAVGTGETLADPAHPIALEPVAVPEPVMTVALEPRTRADRERLGVALGRLALEDPSLRVSSDPETGELLVAGMGELHLDIAVERLASLHRTHVRASAPRIAYLETVGDAAEVEVRHVKQSGGPGQFAHVRLRVEPAPRGAGVRFVSEVRGGEIPSAYVPGVEAGVRNACECGVLDGHPVVDVTATLLGGSFHPKDSSELAFSVAGRRAFLEAMALASPRLLEPMCAVEVRAPLECIGDVIGDLAKRRGRVTGMRDSGEQERVIDALAPLAELFGYVGSLRSHTSGRGSVSMQPAGHALRE